MDDCEELPSGLTARVWTPAAYAEKLHVKLAATAAFPDGRPQAVLAAPGHWNCCDAWVTVPLDWAEVVFALYAVNGPTSELVDWAMVATGILSPVATPDSLSGVLFRARGIPCERFELWAWGLGVELGGPSFARLECWGEDCAQPGGGRDRRLAFEPFAHVEQEWQFSEDVAAGGPTTIAAAHPLGGRSMLRHLTFTAAAAATLLVETVDANAVATRREFLRLGAAGTIVVPYPLPLPSGRGDFWQVTPSGNGTLTAIGHYE